METVRLIRATVAIPTHNRAHTLARTLRSVALLEVPPKAELKCLVIDNASADSTAAVVAQAAKLAPFAVRRVLENRLGESCARNRAIGEARQDSDFLLFIDDDAAADRAWAVEMLAAFDRRGLDAVCGMVLPAWAAPPPRWLGPRLYPKLAVHDRKPIVNAPRAAVETVRNYFGANMALRCATLEKFGRFREDLGVKGGSAISGADTDFFERIAENGGRIGFAAGAIVHHIVDRSRMTRAYLLKKSFAYGVGSAVVSRRSHNHLDKLVRNSVRMLAAQARGDSEGAMLHAMECANYFGYWYGRMATRRHNS
ncbi:MAG: glycosyltransferase [Candidatus Binataceae bacterium]